jgi:hypothetical protein
MAKAAFRDATPKNFPGAYSGPLLQQQQPFGR